MTHNDKVKMQSPLRRARGLGASHHGTAHWLGQRVTAIANIPLVLWLVWSVMHSLGGASYAEFTTWLAQPVNAILMLLAVMNIFYHAHLGSQVMVEDYFHNEALKWMKLIGMKLFFAAMTVACVFSILKIAFTGS